MSSAPQSTIRPPRKRVSLLLALVVVGAAVLVSATAATASPSKFVYELCDSAIPGGNSPSADLVTQSSMVGFNNCASPGGSIGLVETGNDAATFAYLTLGIAPTPGGFVESLTMAGSMCVGAANHFSHIWENNWPPNCVGDSKRTFQVATQPNLFFGGPGGGFAIVMSCDGNVGPCGPGATVAAHYLAATEVDIKAPRVKAPDGSLLAGGILRGHQELIAEASDEGGGLTSVEISVNGLPAAQPTVGSCNVVSVNNIVYQGQAAVTASPCPGKLKGTWLLDTAAYPFQNGANTVVVCASDYSSLPNTTANKTCSTPQTVTVDNSCTESPVSGGEILTAQFARSHKEEVTVAFDKSAKVTGELVTNAGDPVSGATICVQSQVQGSPKGPQPIGTATTDANGRFSYKVDPGPNRRLRIGYRHDTFQVARMISFYAHARPTLKITPGRTETGGEIKMRGKLPGAHSAGCVIVLQASALNSKRWYTFGKATTNKDGVYHARYTFDATTSTTTYRIRAVSPRQHDYPWEAGHSKPVLVVVKGG